MMDIRSSKNVVDKNLFKILIFKKSALCWLTLHKYHKHFGDRGRVAQWLSCCATNRKDAVSNPACVSGFFIDINPSDRNMELGMTQPLTEMNTRSISWW